MDELIDLVLFVMIALVVWIVISSSKAKQRRWQATKDAFSYETPNIHGSTAFGSDGNIQDGGCFDPGGVLVGKSRKSGKRVFFHGTIRPHIGLFGGSGVGKSSHILSILLSWRRSAIVFDVTSEHGAVSGAFRKTLGEAVQFNPFGVMKDFIKLRTVRINPMGPHWLDPKRADFDSRAADIAAAIVSRVDGSNKYFYDTPRNWLTTFILAQVLHGKPEEKNLPYIVRKIINGDLAGYVERIYHITTDPNLRARLERLRKGNGKGEEALKSYRDCLETLRTETEWMLNAAIAESLSASDITFADLRHKKMTLYLELPIAIKTLAPLNKLLLGCATAELFQGEERSEEDVLVVMDELFQYGKDLDSLPKAFAAARKYGVSLLACLTSLEEMEKMWPREGMLNNMGLTIFLDAYDAPTAEMVSKLLGEREVYASAKSVNHPLTIDVPPFGGDRADFDLTRVPNAYEMRELKVSQSYSQQRRPLMNPLEVRQMPLDEEIAFIREIAEPLRLKHAPYYGEADLMARAQPNPFYKGQAKKKVAPKKKGADWTRFLD